MKKPWVIAMALLALAGCDRTPPPAWQLRPDDAGVTAVGQKVYATHCAACHGARLEGQPNWRIRDAAGRLPAPPHDASGHTWHHPDEVLFRITKHGVAKAANLKDYDSGMPAYEGVLTDAEIVAVLSWIKAQWPRETRRLHDEVNAAARSGGKGH
jgi:S-disulfanyl-L-cysteine oxidoreductase SoxD